MKFFIDSANLNDIISANEMGVLDGVTTNPSLIAKENCDFKTRIKEITEIVDGPISAEVLSTDLSGMLKEADELLTIHENIVIKLPLIADGIKATKKLSSQGIKTNVTLCFSPMQALIAAKAGATYISPFVGRLDDIQVEGMDLIAEIVQIYGNYGFDTEVLVASARTVNHVKQAALIGADVVTVPYNVIASLLKHPLTDAGLAIFLKDAKSFK
jgi:transaldolase